MAPRLMAAVRPFFNLYNLSTASSSICIYDAYLHPLEIQRTRTVPFSSNAQRRHEQQPAIVLIATTALLASSALVEAAEPVSEPQMPDKANSTLVPYHLPSKPSSVWIQSVARWGNNPLRKQLQNDGVEVSIQVPHYTLDQLKLVQPCWAIGDNLGPGYFCGCWVYDTNMACSLQNKLADPPAPMPKAFRILFTGQTPQDLESLAPANVLSVATSSASGDKSVQDKWGAKSILPGVAS
ncbi:MAG: hypothetical protein M1825_001994 [Sarcosagium campestre]|nr:MAG: hypothetical protein M1825_001994 [Sarcosagium campestre]